MNKKKRIGEFITCRTAIGCHFPGLIVMVTPHCVLLTVAEVHGARQNGFRKLAGGSLGVRTQVSLQVPEGWHRRDIAEKPRLRLRRRAGVGLSLFQITQDLSNDLLLGDEGNDAHFSAAVFAN